MRTLRNILTLWLGTIMVVVSLPAFTLRSQAAAVTLNLFPRQGKRSEFVYLSGSNFDTNTRVNVYFSEKSVSPGSSIDSQLTTYAYLGTFPADSRGWTGQHLCPERSKTVGYLRRIKRSVASRRIYCYNSKSFYSDSMMSLQGGTRV